MADGGYKLGIELIFGTGFEIEGGTVLGGAEDNPSLESVTIG